ncbi:MAG: carbamoyl-phosphate synthase large subunit [Firmicutes bacterium]|nr:carbamoyl-phosphate synthase large subunit [Bacillota bacterium]
MPKRADLKKVMVIGSGPIIIGQAAEFDYAGTQACKALKEEGLEVALVNSNPATIMTDENMADRVYLEPLVPDVVERILERERPQGLLPTLGGQTGLNLAFELARRGILERLGIDLLGTPLDAIERAKDRERFKATMEAIGEPVPESRTVTTVDEALAFAESVGYPVIVRPAYTLGGTGGGVARRPEQLAQVASKGLKRSLIGQVLVEKSVVGWKEIEYEVMRDGADNCITVCNMENLDPMGIHTGDSIVVAPSQTLTDREHQTLRSAALRIIRALGIQGGCNVQCALAPDGSGRYYVIEVNPRVSRSSALASKATGYPIARVAAKIAVGLRLDEIPNAVTGQTLAAFEPVLDYVVVKIPRWPFDKFPLADRRLGTQMKATGEVMAIDRTLAGALQKAVRSLEAGYDGLWDAAMAALDDGELRRAVSMPDDRRLLAVAEAFRRGFSVEELNGLTGIAPYFLSVIKSIVEAEQELQSHPEGLEARLLELKRLGFSDRRLARLTGRREDEVRELRHRRGIVPVYKSVDTCAGEFEAQTAYYYSTYEREDEAPDSQRRKVLVIGAGPIRIGQGIEFDYCSVHSVWALQRMGYEAVIVNNNPETVSTDFDTSDRLYFEPLTLEDVLEVVRRERPEAVIVQFGGQTAINLARPLADRGVPILGTSADAIDLAEDRRRFAELLGSLGIPQAEGAAASSLEEALGIANKLGYPLMVRPSYVLGGRAMEICHDEDELLEYIKMAVQVAPEHPVLLDRYLPGREIEVDAICDGEQVLIPGIMEHIERAGVHSGDSTAVFPPVHLTPEQEATIVQYTRRLALALGVRGLLNVQFVVSQGRVYVLEANPRASRTVPYLSKVTGIPMVALATQVMAGASLASLGYTVDGLVYGRTTPPPFTAVKAPVFSFDKLDDVDVLLGPEMKSTGEVLGLNGDYPWALYKALLGAGINVRTSGTALVTLADRDKQEALPTVRRLAELGFRILATTGTLRFLEAHGVRAEFAHKVGEGHPDVVELVRAGQIDLVINTPTRGRIPERNGFKLRRAAVEFKVPCFTSLDLAAALVEALAQLRAGQVPQPVSLQEYTMGLMAPAGAGRRASSPRRADG